MSRLWSAAREVGGKSGRMQDSAFRLAAGCAFCLMALTGVPFRTSCMAEASAWGTLHGQTVRAFENYVAMTEARNAESLRQGNFLSVDDLPVKARAELYAKLKQGEIELWRARAGEGRHGSGIPEGMIHDWEGIVFIPGVKIADVLRVLQDYDRHGTYYAPDVEKAKIESHHGDHYLVYLRFRRQMVVTVVLNTEHEVTYFEDSVTRAHSRSSAIRIAEVENPGSPQENEKRPGEDSGFLWRMETWWRLEEKDAGVYLQNEVVTLTRDIPTGLAWLIGPFITSIPRETLEFTLGATRNAVLALKKN
jgi:hypothetical protein